MTVGVGLSKLRSTMIGAAMVAAGMQHAQAQTPPDAATNVVQGGTVQGTTVQAEAVLVKARRRLLKEKNSPSASTELGEKQVAQEGVVGSTSTLLRQAPSVYVYQTGPGENAPVLSIRGTRGLEIAATLDDVPMQDLLNGGTTGYLGNRFTLDQIDGVTIYPGVAYPDKNTFGTIGGTIAYTSQRSGPDFALDVTGSVASFGTYAEGFTLQSGAVDSPLGTGDNAARVLLSYQNLQSAGYVDYTPARYNTMEFAFDKPYDDGLSKFQATVLFNTGSGALQSEPTPGPLLDAYGRFNNYSPGQLFEHEQNSYLTVYAKNDTYINDSINAGVSVFYRNSDNAYQNWENPEIANNGAPPNVYPAVTVPINYFYPDQFGIGPGGYYVPGHFTYNPNSFLNDAKNCPADVNYGPGQSVCGLTAQAGASHTDSYGIQPRLEFLLPQNTIKIGGLIAKETAPTPTSYIWGSPNVPQINGFNQFQPNGYGGGSQRTIYLAYAQDKIDVFGNTLHLTPGGTIEGTYSSNRATDFAIVGAASDAYPDGVVNYIPSYKLHKFDRDALPFFNASYDLDKIAPAAAGTSFYASFGTSALFAPTNDFGPTTTGGVPYASIVHMYEGGVRYDTSNLLLSLDYFYQKVDRDFGYFAGSGTTSGQNFYGNSGQREFKGVESAATWQVTPHWQIFANGSYLLAKYLVTQPSFSTIGEDQYGLALKGTPISGVPKFLANFGVDYETKQVWLDGDSFSARLSGQYTGQQYSTYDLSAFQIVPPYPPDQTQGDTVTDLHHQLPEFAVFNLLMNYTLPLPSAAIAKSVKFELNIQNIFDERYFQYYYSQIAPTNGEYTSAPYLDGLPGEPFSTTFTMTARF
jgi:iron complex outermembrane receptor protein